MNYGRIKTDLRRKKTIAKLNIFIPRQEKQVTSIRLQQGTGLQHHFHGYREMRVAAVKHFSTFVCVFKLEKITLESVMHMGYSWKIVNPKGSVHMKPASLKLMLNKVKFVEDY